MTSRVPLKVLDIFRTRASKQYTTMNAKLSHGSDKGFSTYQRNSNSTKIECVESVSQTGEFLELVHNFIFKLAFWNVSNKETEVCHRHVYFQLLSGPQFIVIQLYRKGTTYEIQE